MEEPKEHPPEVTQVTTAKTLTVSNGNQSIPGTLRNDIFRMALGLMVTVGFFGLIGTLIFKFDMLSIKEILFILVGHLSAKWGTVIDYVYGGSAGGAVTKQMMANKP